MSERPQHEESCNNPGSYWGCDCRMRITEEEMACRQPLYRCGVCDALSTEFGIDRHLDWHWQRGDFA